MGSGSWVFCMVVCNSWNLWPSPTLLFGKKYAWNRWNGLNCWVLAYKFQQYFPAFDQIFSCQILFHAKVWPMDDQNFVYMHQAKLQLNSIPMRHSLNCAIDVNWSRQWTNSTTGVNTEGYVFSELTQFKEGGVMTYQPHRDASSVMYGM